MEPVKKTNGKRNRSAGHAFECLVVKLLKDIGFKNVATCRAANRMRDGQGVDITNVDEHRNGRLPYNFQCKSYSTMLDYHKVLDAMPKDGEAVNVILHRYTKANSGGRFMIKGDYAILKMEDLLQMVQDLETYRSCCHISKPKGADGNL